MTSGEVKKIAFVIWSLAAMGGSERVVYDIVRKLDRSRYPCMVVGFEDGPFRSLYEEIGVESRCISKSRKIDLEFVRGFRKILEDGSIDIVNPHHFSPLLYTFLATRFTRIRLVYTEHSRWQLDQLEPHKKIANRIMLRHADGLVAISGQIMDYYLNSLGIPRERVHLIYNGIDTAAFGSGRENGLRLRLGIGEDELVIGTVANIRPEKNLKLLVSSFSDLLKTGRKAKLIVAGEDFMEGELQSFADRSGVSERVLFLGMRDDVSDLLKLFGVFCLPSIHEGLPLTVLEAMAAGVPVVGADVLGINEVIRHGETGLLFPSNDREGLTQCLLLLAGNDPLRHRLSLAGKGFVERTYSLESKIAQYERLFGSI